MRCPYCQCSETRVVDSRESEDVTRRRRECDSCSKRFTTYERVEAVALTVLKKDGRRESFDREKLRRGLLRACEKTSVTIEQVNTVVDRIEARLRGLATTEIPSRRIGELAMRYLRTLDKVAYVRFASVYREFADVGELYAEVQRLVEK